jgi:hypothetical protein
MPAKPVTMQAVRKLALRHPETEEGIACEGTPVERRTVKARKKAFLFLGASDAMLKLRDSLPEATRLARKDPAAYRVGANGWVKALFGTPGGATLELLSRWIDESYQLVVSPAPAGTLAKVARRRASSGQS